MTEELKPCPFCGGEAGIYDDESGVLWIRCNATQTTCPPNPLMQSLDSEAEAVAAWNRRHQGHPPGKEIERAAAWVEKRSDGDPVKAYIAGYADGYGRGVDESVFVTDWQPIEPPQP